MINNCINPDMLISILLNILIVLTFLTIFFITYVSTLERKILRNKLKIIIDENLTSILNNIDVKDQGKLKEFLKLIEPKLDRIDQYTSIDNENTETYNNAVKILSYISIGVIAMILLTLILTLFYANQKCFNLKNIIIESVIIFIFIGIIEFLFFYYIAQHYVPINASEIISLIISNMQNK